MAAKTKSLCTTASVKLMCLQQMSKAHIHQMQWNWQH